MRLDFWDLKSSGCLFFSYVVWCVKVQMCLNSFCYHAGKHVAESNKKTSCYIVLAFPAAQDKKIVVMTFLLWLDLPFVSHYLSLVLCHRFPVGRLHQPSREHQAFFLESIRARCCQSLPLRHPSSTVGGFWLLPANELCSVWGLVRDLMLRSCWFSSQHNGCVVTPIVKIILNL